MNGWTIVERQPKPFGLERKKREKELGQQYPDGWQETWRWGDIIISKSITMSIIEDAYYHYLREDHNTLLNLLSQAAEVYEQGLDDIESGIDYTKQEGMAFHYSDIALRRAVIRLGEEMRGEMPICIPRPLFTGEGIMPKLSTYNAPFHVRKNIIRPYVEGDWKENSIECFYQSNRVIIAREKEADVK